MRIIKTISHTNPIFTPLTAAAITMANSTFIPPPNGLVPENLDYTFLIDQIEANVSDYLLPNNGSFQDFASEDVSMHKQMNENSVVTYSGDHTPSSSNMSTKCNKSGVTKIKKDVGSRIAFRMKSELEIIDDGFKWRKYGKKKVKNSPNPRNYYRCSSGGCHVKKRVERDPEDSSYVITTYDGMHNHESPCVIYYNETPLMVPSGWTLQASHSPS